MITRFLIHLGVDEETARADACRIEHDISDATFAAMVRHAAALRANAGEASLWEREDN